MKDCPCLPGSRDSAERKNFLKWCFLYAMAALVLFLGLGEANIMNSEGRWLAVAHDMLKNGNWLHPTINGQAYYDKPLVSYWLIAGLSWLCGGVSEWTARVPSAVAALAALFCTASIAKRLYGERAAFLSASILMTMYSFLYWGRLAEADMENTAFIMAALAWYFRVRENPGFLGYAVFFVLCAVGAQTKGLAAFVLPCVLVFVDMLLSKTLIRHLNWKSIVSLFLGLAVYGLPFFLAACAQGDYSANGFVLVFRENIVRAISPWDHKDDPWYVYFRYVPQLIAPWSPFFVLSLIWFVKNLISGNENASGSSAARLRARWNEVDPREKWLLGATLIVFVMFSASQSRRVYYILPIIPLCAMMTGVFFDRVNDGWLKKIALFLVKIVDYAIPLVAVLAVIAGPIAAKWVYPRIVGPTGAELTPKSFYLYLYVFPAVFGVLLATVWFVLKRTEKRREQFFLRFPSLERVVLAVALVFLLVFGIFLPATGGDAAFRKDKQFCETTSRILNESKIPAQNKAFFGGDYSYLVYYLRETPDWELYSMRKNDERSRTFFDDTSLVKGMDEFRDALARYRTEGGAILARFDALTMLPADLRSELLSGDGGTVLRQSFPVHEYRKIEGRFKVDEVFSGTILPSAEEIMRNKGRLPGRMKLFGEKLILRVWYPNSGTCESESPNPIPEPLSAPEQNREVSTAKAEE